MNPSSFREYDIRGVADRDLTDEFAHSLGRAVGNRVALPGKSIAVGRDCRLSSTRLRDAFVAGLCEAGAHVVDIGVVPSPVLYFSVHHYDDIGAGVIITGSHNPAQDNGFKMLREDGAVYGDAIRALRDDVASGALPSGGGGSITERSCESDYLEAARAAISLGERRFAVVLDAGNGTGGPLGCELLRSLGVTVHELYCDMDGSFPNHHPDPTVESNLAALKAKVAEVGAEVGFAFDGDADRLGVVDGNGRVLWGDQQMILFGKAILREQPGATFIGEVKCSQAMYDELSRAGGNPIMWKVGHSLIKAKMKETKAALAGEMSGHLFFADRYYGFDDAPYAAARMVELLSKGKGTLAELYDQLPVMVNTPEVRVDCPDDVKFAVVADVKRQLSARDDVAEVIDVDGARALFDGGWGLVRASNTQPSLVVRCEARDAERLAEIRAIIESEIAAARGRA